MPTHHFELAGFFDWLGLNQTMELSLNAILDLVLVIDKAPASRLVELAPALNLQLTLLDPRFHFLRDDIRIDDEAFDLSLRKGRLFFLLNLIRDLFVLGDEDLLALLNGLDLVVLPLKDLELHELQDGWL